MASRTQTIEKMNTAATHLESTLRNLFEDTIEDLCSKKNDSAKAYLEYQLDSKTIQVEFIPGVISEEIIGLPPDIQKRIVGDMCRKTSKLGEQVHSFDLGDMHGVRVFQIIPDGDSDMHIVVTY